MDTVLFVCYNNGGRSQIAESIFNARATERGVDAHAESCGLLGVGGTHPMVIRCIEEIGISSEGLKPKQLTKDMIDRAETIIVFGGVNSDHTAIKFTVNEEWSMPNPAGLPYGSLCQVRDEISHSVDELLDRLPVRS